MTEFNPQTAANAPAPRGMGCLKVLGLMLLTVIISVGVSYWLITSYLFPKPFAPVALDQKEQSVLEDKLRHFGINTGSASASPAEAAGQLTKTEKLTPQPYSEVGAKREVTFSEREVNAMLAKKTDLAEQLVIDLADNLASAQLLLPLDPDFPFFGGKTLRASAGMELSYQNERPIVILKGASVWGVPIPNAWLGGLKNVDLVKEFGAEDGFWKSFADGVEHIQVKEGSLVVKLKE